MKTILHLPNTRFATTLLSRKFYRLLLVFLIFFWSGLSAGAGPTYKSGHLIKGEHHSNKNNRNIASPGQNA